jgi:predicted Zn-dependent protease
MKINLLLSLVFTFFTAFQSFSQTSIDKDKQQGAEANEQLKQVIGVYEHSSSIYLNDIGQRLVSNLENQIFDYQFGILDMTEPNAMALPGGYVYFSRGILILANSEDELAGVMGHETIHVHERHSRKSQNKGIFTGILKIPGAIVGVFAPTAGGLLMAPFSLMDASYSRKHEKQADELGAELAAKSGYDPYGLPKILDKISEDTKLETGVEEKLSFYSTHPYTPDRIEDLNKEINKIDYNKTEGIAANHKAFIDKLDGIIIGDNPAHGTFQDSLFIHPDLNFTLEYPMSWDSENTPAAAGIFSPDKKAQVVFALSDTSKTPDQSAKEFAEAYYRYYAMEPTRGEKLNINGFPAYILVYEAPSEEGLAVFSMLWLKRNDYTFKFSSLGLAQYREVSLSMANSLHTITDLERNSIKQTEVDIVAVKDGETIEDLSSRTGNVLQLEYLALINNVAVDEKLRNGQWVKIGVVTKYVSE